LTKKTVLLSSFHSSSPYALEKHELEPDLIISFDSHIDTSLLGYRKEVVEIIGDDREQFYAAARAATHAIFARKFGESGAKVIIVTSKLAFESDVAFLEQKVRNLKPELEELGFAELVANRLEGLRSFFGLELLTCPPKDPVASLAPLINNAESPVIDIDVDYFADFQTECYTPLKNANLSELGNLERVLRLIRSTQPAIITLSESKVDALNTPSSKTNHLLTKLRNMGYAHERFHVYENDDEALHYLSEWELFSKKNEAHVNRKILSDIASPDMSGDDGELSRRVKEYFRS
jgi:hypothetical protein